MSIDQYSTTPANNDLTSYFKTGMRPSAVKNAGWDIMADIASYLVSLPTAGGTANALTVANGRPFGALKTGLLQILVPASANTTAATFAPDGLTAAPIHAWGKALLGGEMQPGVPVALQYDGTNWNLSDPQIGPLGLLSGALEVTIFTANGNFTPLTTGKYLVVGIGGGGGGGGGGGSTGTTNAGGQGGYGGSGGQLGFSLVNLTAGTAYAVVIGGGGGGGSAGPATTGSGGDGSVGAATSFNAVTVGAGGGGGRGGIRGGVGATGGAGAGGNGGGNGGGQGPTINTSGAGTTGGAGAANTGGGGGGGSAGVFTSAATAGGAGGQGGSGILFVIRA